MEKIKFIFQSLGIEVAAIVGGMAGALTIIVVKGKTTLKQALQKLTVGVSTAAFVGSGLSSWFDFTPSVVSAISFFIATIAMELLTEIPLVVKAVLDMLVKHPDAIFSRFRKKK